LLRKQRKTLGGYFFCRTLYVSAYAERAWCLNSICLNNADHHRSAEMADIVLVFKLQIDILASQS